MNQPIGSTIICNLGLPQSSTKARNLEFYLDGIKKLGREFKSLEAICTDGDIRPPYRYQWRAISNIVAGEDDPFEGLGGTPIEAMRNLYKSIKYAVDHPEEVEE